MKAIILERRGDWAAALREDGTVVKTRAAGEVGKTIELAAEITALPKTAATRRWGRIAVAAALALVIAGSSYTYYNTAMAASYVSVDVGESSVELSVNRQGKVIGVTALNDESRELAEELTGQVDWKDVEEAMDVTMAHLREKGYLDGEDDLIVGVTPEKATAQSSQAGEDALTQAVERSVERNSEGDDTVYVYEGYRAARNEARKQGQSMGRFRATEEFYEKLEEIYGNDVFGQSGDLSDLEELAPALTPPVWMEDWAHQKGYEGYGPGPDGGPRPPAVAETPDATQAVAIETPAVESPGGEPPVVPETPPAEPSPGEEPPVRESAEPSRRPDPQSTPPVRPGEPTVEVTGSERSAAPAQEPVPSGFEPTPEQPPAEPSQEPPAESQSPWQPEESFQPGPTQSETPPEPSQPERPSAEPTPEQPQAEPSQEPPAVNTPEAGPSQGPETPAPPSAEPGGAPGGEQGPGGGQSPGVPGMLVGRSAPSERR